MNPRNANSILARENTKFWMLEDGDLILFGDQQYDCCQDIWYPVSTSLVNVIKACPSWVIRRKNLEYIEGNVHRVTMSNEDWEKCKVVLGQASAEKNE